MKKKYGKTRLIIKNNNMTIFDASLSTIYNISALTGQTIFEQKFERLTVIIDFNKIKGGK